MKLRRNHFLSTWTFFFLHVSIEKFLGKKWVYLTILPRLLSYLINKKSVFYELVCS